MLSLYNGILSTSNHTGRSKFLSWIILKLIHSTYDFIIFYLGFNELVLFNYLMVLFSMLYLSQTDCILAMHDNLEYCSILLYLNFRPMLTRMTYTYDLLMMFC